MKKTLLVLAPLCCLLAACASTTPSASFIPNCPAGPTADTCPQGPDGRPVPSKRNQIKIVVSADDIKVQPPIVCTSPGDTITVTVVGIPTNARVATVPKDGADGWILSSRTGDGTMSIEVPDVPDGDYSYFAMTSTGKCQDPKIHVD